MKVLNTAAAAILAAAAFATAAGAFAAPTALPAAPAAQSAPAGTLAPTPVKALVRVHSRRAEVARRLRVAHMRIEKAKREGRISVRRAAFLHHKERLIRREARMEAREHRGALTKVEVRTLRLKEHRLMKAIAQ